MLRLALVILLGVAFPLNAQTKVPSSQAEISLGFAPLVKQAAPAVVNIYVKRVVQTRSSPFQGDPFFEDMFKGMGKSRPRVQNSLGSGVILTADGFVVSNYHVVGDATDIRVVLNDRREFAAKVVLADQDSDLALLQLEGAPKLPYLHLRDSDTVEVGELVLAIGNPFGVGQTVSSGIVSGLARSGGAMGSSRGYFIQTDAPINPGNSGGALVDVNGALIGVNTRIVSRSGGSNGIGFAIPAKLVGQFVEQARAGNTSFERPWAGMSGQPVDADMAESIGLMSPGGIMISELHPESPFYKAGFKAGEVIMAVDDEPVNTPAEMIFRMSVSGVGNESRIQVFTDGETDHRIVRLTTPPDRPARDELLTDKSTRIPGVKLSNINPAVLAEHGLPLRSDGVVVVDPGPLGTRAGLRRSDVIMLINGERVSDTGEARRKLEASGRWMSLGVERGGQRVTLKFRL
ncbi:trypsin-like peptidase domain-containing protein [Lentibacter algarum]|uniref:trypsin-like peptidase domain-containing protein n=1 Tax=Lentibacter algarum TaxID=576131 RepID=UPI001C069FA9|nr:trypsin-like peptidase domain-containing protein [Lentibacter algarum]MBU2980270.1 trypsin-like peptidase domain-containing protein [Lentibacter algarum]